MLGWQDSIFQECQDSGELPGGARDAREKAGRCQERVAGRGDWFKIQDPVNKGGGVGVGRWLTPT